MKILWTDGSAEPNPGAGGFAVIEQNGSEGRPVAMGGEEYSTNIRMEGKALIAAMEYAGEDGCEIYTDSEFWVKTMTQWAPDWERMGWKKKGGLIKNKDLVIKMYNLYKRYPVKLNWVRGHEGTKFNEMADKWANKARADVKL